MTKLTLNAVVDQQPAVPINLSAAPVVPLITAPTINQPHTQLQVTPPPYAEVILFSGDLSLLLSWSMELTSGALSGLISFICREVMSSPPTAYAMEMTLNPALEMSPADIPQFILDESPPQVCDSSFIEEFCMCDHMHNGAKCQTCITAERTAELFREITWELIEKVQFPMHALPKGYRGPLYVEVLGPTDVRVKFQATPGALAMNATATNQLYT